MGMPPRGLQQAPRLGQGAASMYMRSPVNMRGSASMGGYRGGLGGSASMRNLGGMGGYGGGMGGSANMRRPSSMPRLGGIGGTAGIRG